ncbi:MAG: leucine-rich repeat protein [Clostridiales bacterium]|jgi:uncharacterized repeat protein (TIGR02543 family)|nr:leucine-rich repeat protein [Clostridiales bacterium]
MKKKNLWVLFFIAVVFASLSLSGCEWLFRDRTPSYVITFVRGNGDEDTVIKVRHGDAVPLPSAPKKDGYVFTAWYTDADSGTVFAAGTTASKNMTLYARYLKVYTLSGGVYDYFSDAPIENCRVLGLGNYHSGARAALSADIAEGYVFEGFYLNGERFSSYTAVNVTVSSDAVYTVKVKRGLYVRAKTGVIAGGAVTINGERKGSVSLLEGARAEIAAEVYPGYRFEGFFDVNGSLYTAETRFEITVNDNAEFTAEFSYTDYTVSVVSSDPETGTVTLSPVKEVYRIGDVLTVDSAPVAGNFFLGLFLDLGENDDPACVAGADGANAVFGIIDLINAAAWAKLYNPETGKYDKEITDFKLTAEFKATDFSDEHYVYQKISGGAKITGIAKPFETGTVNVPAEIGGLPVVQISAEAFRGREDAVSVYLPSSLRSFSGNTNPFEFCPNLASVVVGSNNPYFYTSNGVLFNKTATKLIAYPCAKADENYNAPSALTEIGVSAFGGQRFLKNFSAAGLRTVSPFAFENSAVESFSLSGAPSSFDIGEFAFYNCKKLSALNINFPGTVSGTSKVSRYAFSGCENLSSVVLNGIKTLNEEVFSGCRSLAGITLPRSLTALSGDVFGGAGLINIYVDPESETFEESDGILYDKKNKAVVRCPEKRAGYVGVRNGAAAVSAYAFKNCALITDVSLPDSVSSIGADAFMNAYALYSLSMGTGVLTIGNRAFHGCLALTALTISNSLESVGGYAFFNTGITYLDMGSAFERAAATAFNGMPYLTEIDFPNTVADLGERYNNIDGEMPIFAGCPKLISINVAEGGTTDYTSSPESEGNSGGILYKGDRYTVNGVTTFAERELIARCPEGKTGTVTIKSQNMIKIGSGAFANSKASRVFFDFDGALKQNLLIIGREAFSYAAALTEINIPSSVTTIGDDAFLECESLSKVTLPASLQKIGDFAFAGCAPEEVRIPDKVQYIYAFAFYGNKNLKRVYIAKTTAPHTSTFRGYANIFGGHHADLKIYVMMTQNGTEWKSNISNFTDATGWGEYKGRYADYHD